MTIEISDSTRLVSRPLVSVYMLTYRHEPYLAQAIESVVAQDCDFPFELIIGEDCSPDATREIAERYQRAHPNLIRLLVTEKNIGAKANAARCQAAARGKLVAICEGDDYWCDSSKLRKQVATFQAYPTASMVCSDALYVDADTSRTLRQTRLARHSRQLSVPELILGDGGFIPTASIVVRKSVLENRPTWAREAPIGDYPMVLSAALSGSVLYLAQVTAAYRVNVPHSWTRRHVATTSQRGLFADSIRDMLHGFQHSDHERHRAEVREVISKYYFDAIARTAGSPSDKLALFNRARDEMTTADRLVARAALATGLNLGWLRTPEKRIKAARLRRAYDRREPQIGAGAA